MYLISSRRFPGLGLFAGRIGNFINGELWGKITDVPWGFMVNGEVRHASQLYEAALEGLVLFIDPVALHREAAAAARADGAVPGAVWRVSLRHRVRARARTRTWASTVTWPGAG